MPKYIDAKQVLNLCANQFGSCGEEAEEVIHRLWNAVKELPAANVRENTYGEWVYGEYEYTHCSECGFEWDRPECVSSYCPGCGAYMEDEDL